MTHFIKGFLFAFLLLVLPAACTQKSNVAVPARPEHLLSQEQMAGLIIRMQLLEATVNLKNTQRQTLQKKDSLRYGNIFRECGSSYDNFQENFKYYASQPDQLNKIYDRAIAELTRRQAEEDRKK
ncbi:MAG TPA: DUF4296 domain-containing protein [Bacteroidia bacterium]|nr:DUF4296 domain-containing protein [Bacteroidia bacterium]